jgi:hypothetical protein
MGEHGMSPATLLPYLFCKRLRPVALRPVLSNSLPFSGLSYDFKDSERMNISQNTISL